MLGVKSCPYCGGEIEMVKLTINEREKEEKKPQPYRIECCSCRALVARGQGFPVESKSEAKERIDQYNKYIENLNGRPNGNGRPSTTSYKSRRYKIC